MSAIKNLLINLSKAKSEIGKIAKDSTNPFFNSKYFDVNSLLEHVEPLLEKNGLLLLQPIDNGRLRTEIYDIESCEKIFSEMELPNLNDPQKMGSAITYYRRYTLQSLLGLQAEDDDGNKASAASKKQSQPSSQADNGKELPWLNKMDKEKNFTPQWKNILEAINQGKVNSLSDVRKYYKVSKELAADLEQIFNYQTA